MSKRLTSIRVPEITDRQLAELASATGLNTTELITTAIDRMYQQEINEMSTYYITEEMLGDQTTATADDARRMVALLAERGYDVAYGHPRRGQRDEEIRQEDWDEALDILSREKYGQPAE